MDSYYFTYWINRHGIESFKKLLYKVCTKISVPSKILKQCDKDEYLFQYLFAVYYTTILNYFGLNVKQISFLMDYSQVPGVSKLFSPREILKVQKDNIPYIEKYIIKDLKLYDNF